MNTKIKDKSKKIIDLFKNRVARLSLKKNRDPDRIKTDGESMDLLMNSADDAIIIQEESDFQHKVTWPWYQFYHKNGFKRWTGIGVAVGGYLVKILAPELEFVGTILEEVGVGLGIFGYGHSLKKNYEKDGETYVDKIKVFKMIAEAIIKIVKVIMPLFKKTNKKGDSNGKR